MFVAYTAIVCGRRACAVRLPCLLGDSIAETCLEQLPGLFQGEPVWVTYPFLLEVKSLEKCGAVAILCLDLARGRTLSRSPHGPLEELR